MKSIIEVLAIIIGLLFFALLMYAMSQAKTPEDHRALTNLLHIMG